VTHFISATTLLATLAVAAPLSAQQPGPPAARVAAPAPDMQAHMRMMDSMSARRDSAMARVNRTTGEARVNALADALNALVDEQRMMHAHMKEMMGEHMGARPAMGHPMEHAPAPGMAHPGSAHAMPGMARPDSSARPPK
jgi:hypothetical protein